MSTYKLYLFGPPRLKRDSETLELRHRKAISLLAYLVVTKQPHSRDTLTTMLWPEYGQSEARTHLRRELLRLRKLLGNERDNPFSFVLMISTRLRQIPWRQLSLTN